MALLTFPSSRSRYTQAKPDAASAGTPEGSPAATLRRLCRSAFSILLIMLALAAIIALEAAFYVPRGGH
jgi:hypothetical protein